MIPLQLQFTKDSNMPLPIVALFNHRKQAGLIPHTMTLDEFSASDIFPKPSKPLRVGTFNICRFSTETCTTSLQQFLDDNGVDVCGLQEVSGINRLREAFKDTDRWECIFDKAYPTYGTGLVFRCDKLKLVYQKTHVLKEAPGKKTALEVILESREVPEYKLHIFNTHLDHKTEKQRLIEWETLSKVLPDTPHLLIGDFNALRRDDYSDEQWKEIGDVRSAANWEAPLLDLTSAITTKYQDVLGQCGGVIEPTSRFKTRVDYIFRDPKVNNLTPDQAKVINSNGISDHNMIVCDI